MSSMPDPTAAPISTERMIIRTNDGYFVHTNPDDQGRVIATTRERREATVFVKEVFERHVAIRDEARGMYVRAVAGGSGLLLADAQVRQAHELHVEGEAEFGRSLKTHGGWYWSAIGGGGSSVDAVVRHALSHESFHYEEPIGIGGGGGVAGGLRSQQITADPAGGLLVGGRPALVTSVHDGSGLSQFFYNRPEYERRARISAAAGFLLSRSWWDVDGPYWEGQQLRPHWPNGNRVLTPDTYGEQRYIDTCVEFLRFNESLGMALHIARGTWTGTRSDRMAEIVREIIRQAGVHTIGIGEGVNEQDAVTPHTPISEVTRFRERAYEGVALRCNTAIGGMDFEAQMVNGDRLRRFNPGAMIIPFHGYRGGGVPNKLERDWNVKYDWEIPLAVDGEGIGIGPYVSDHQNQHELNGAFFRIRHALLHACGYVPTLMSGAGVIPDGNRSEPWGSQPGFDDVCKVRDILPADAGHFRDVFHGGDRWGNKRYFRAIGDTRVEHHIEPETQRGIIIAYGNEAAHIPMHRHFSIENDVWIEEGHIKGRVIIGRG